MRVTLQMINVMGQGWGEKGRHLPTLYSEDYSQSTDDPWHLGITAFNGFTAGDFDTTSLSFDMVFTSTRSELFWTSALLNAIVMAGAIRGRTEGNKSSLRHGIALEPLMFFWSGYGLVDAASNGLTWETKLGFFFDRPAELPLSVPSIFFKASGSRLVELLIFPCSTSVVARSCSHSAAAAFVMPRLCHRMRCRRGTPRRAPSSLASNSPSLSSNFTSCHYPRTHSGRGRLHLPSHYPETRPPDSSSSPSFGSVTFTFNCSLNHPKITAHVSVLFLVRSLCRIHALCRLQRFQRAMLLTW